MQLAELKKEVMALTIAEQKELRSFMLNRMAETEDNKVVDRLKLLAEEVLNRKVNWSRRTDDDVWANIMVAMVLRYRGYSLFRTGTMLNKSHCTITYYERVLRDTLSRPRNGKRLNQWNEYFRITNGYDF